MQATPGDPVVLYMSTVLVRCGGQLFPVDVAAGPGLGISDRSLRLYEAEPEPI